MKKIILIILLIHLLSCSEKDTVYEYDANGNLKSILFTTRNHKDSLRQFDNNRHISTVYFNNITQLVDSLVGYSYYNENEYKSFRAIKDEKSKHYTIEKIDSLNKIVGRGYAKLSNKKNEWVLIQNGWFSQFYEGELIRKIDYMSKNDSLFINQFKEYDDNESIIDSFSMFYEVSPTLENLKHSEKYTKELELHYVSKSNYKNFDAVLILTNELAPDFSNLNEIKGVENIYNVEPLDNKKWKFDLFYEKEGNYNLRGFIYFTDHYFEQSKTDSTLLDAIIIEKYILIDEKIEVK